jgi:uncharacterized protein YbdZ (MbtH family)
MRGITEGRIGWRVEACTSTQNSSAEWKIAAHWRDLHPSNILASD